jgi:hypothetical protein
MKNGEFVLAKQLGSKGYYGRIRLAVEPTISRMLTVDFQAGTEQQWRSGAEFGIVYGWELYHRGHPAVGGLQVRVLEIHSQPVDTTNLVIAFVAANALWNALEWLPTRLPTFDLKNGIFSFPKW